MCVTWTRKYPLCGCIWVEEDIFCEADQICLGRRMVIRYSHLQTCKECWKSGDKRINETIAKMVRHQLEMKDDITQGSETHDESPSGKTESPGLFPSIVRVPRETGGRQCDNDKKAPKIPLTQPDKCTCKNAPTRLRRADDIGNETGRESDDEAYIEDNDITRTNPSRPQTPITDYDLDPDNLPWYLLHYEYYCDMSRPCEPVKLSSMHKDYRTTREKSNWIYLKDEVGQDVEPDPETCEYDENVSSEWDRGDLSPWWWWKRECNY
ncbi:hypothetical protein N7513_012894 [Penicillium frequentans]|nr:hypothetical protein N7513_012894 [Penicillium glabrum]